LIAPLALLLSAPGPASALTLHATRTDDPKVNGCERQDCSLREAVIAAGRHPGPDEIVLRSGKTYRLTQLGGRENGARRGDLDFVDGLTIHASGRRSAEIDGRAMERMFQTRDRESHLRFDRVDMAGGTNGGIDSWGAVALARSRQRDSGRIGIDARQIALRRSVVRGNQGMGIDSYRGGTSVDSKIVGNGYGGIYVCKHLTMRRTLVGRNTGGWLQAAITLSDFGSSPNCEGTPPFTIVNSRIVGNGADEDGSGGGILAFEYSVGGVIRDSVIARNAGDWGGLYGGGIRLIDSRVVGNVDPMPAGSRLIAGGVTGVDDRIVRSSITGNSGHIGGMFLSGSRVRESTVAGNHATVNGGGIDLSRTTITNSTIANNDADGDGGGIFANWGLKLRSSTVAYNEADADNSGPDPGYGGSPGGGGIFARADQERFVVTNSLVALNTVGEAGSGPDCAGPFDSTAHSLLSALDAACTGFDAPSDLVVPDPGIGHLADNGGPTETIALRKGSAAIGAASRKTSPPRDQRGVKRDRRPDIGAFERR
jgi:hypothetical protein